MRLYKSAILIALTILAVSCTADNIEETTPSNQQDRTFSGNDGAKSNNFHKFCLNNFDKNGDGSLSEAEMSGVTEIDCSSQGLPDLKGLANFVNLETLKCAHNNLKELDLSANRKLRYLDCSYNFLEKLDVSATAITTLYCYPMNDANGNNLLKYLYIYRGQVIEGITTDSPSKDKRIPDGTMIVSVPSSKDGDTEKTAPVTTDKRVKP